MMLMTIGCIWIIGATGIEWAIDGIKAFTQRKWADGIYNTVAAFGTLIGVIHLWGML